MAVNPAVAPITGSEVSLTRSFHPAAGADVAPFAGTMVREEIGRLS
jgi:hypothetical protein